MPVTQLLTTIAEAAPRSAEQQLLDIDGTLFIQLGFFLLLMAILRKVLFAPYLRVREERVSRIDGYRAEAARLEADAAARLARCEADLAEARRVGAAERTVARAEAQAQEQAILAAAQANAQRTLADARVKLEQALAGERATISARVAELGRAATRKILGREVAQ